MESFQYVIIGGGQAGGAACDGIRKIDAQGSIALVTREPQRPYQRPPLSKGYLLGREGLDKVYLRDAAYYATQRITLLAGVEVSRLDCAAHRLALADGRELGYGKLLLATGAQAARLPLPGAELPGVQVLRSLADADALRGLAVSGQRALVIGGSFIGSEVAAALAQLGLQVTMVFAEERLLQRIAPPALSVYLQSMYQDKGIRLLPGSRPQRCEGQARVERVLLDDGQTLDVDLVVMGVGVWLDTALAHDSGLVLGERGSVLVDETLRSSDPDVYAAGDIAAWPDATTGKRLRVEHWDVARQQGQRAGRNMAGENKPYRALPYFFSDLFDLSLEVWGDLSAWEQTVLRGNLSEGSYAYFYFAQDRLTGVLAVKRPEAERKAVPALVRARPAYADAAARLSDPSVDLSSLP